MVTYKYEDPELQDMFQMRLASLDLKSQKRRVREIVMETLWRSFSSAMYLCIGEWGHSGKNPGIEFHLGTAGSLAYLISFDIPQNTWKLL